MTQGRLFIGTSGWSYESWHGIFYPPGVSRSGELAFLAHELPSVEINASFYRLQRPGTYRRWAEQVPDDFCFAVKGGRFITHLRRLRNAEQGLANFLASGVMCLGEKLGVLLWQLPPDLAFDQFLLADFLDMLPYDARAAGELAARHDRGDKESHVDSSGTPSRWRHAIEPRHSSFRTDAAAGLFADRGVAVVHSDSPGRWPALDQDTADFRYVRLHGHSELYASRYAAQSLDRWAQRCAEWTAAGQDVHLYFDNDARGHAPRDAVGLLSRLIREPAGSPGP